jgi:acyl-CoA thioesterase
VVSPLHFAREAQPSDPGMRQQPPRNLQDLERLGLDIHDGSGSLLLDDRHASPLGVLHGGAGLSFVVAAIESATGLPTRWATTQFVDSAEPGERLHLSTEVLAQGRSSMQLHVRAHSDGRLVLHGTGASGRARLGVPDRSLVSMPDVGGPDQHPETGLPIVSSLAYRGHLAHVEFRRIPGQDDLLMWVRMPGQIASRVILPFITDYLPLAVMVGIGMPGGGGTSLDNTIRFGSGGLTRSEWVLFDGRAELTGDGYGHATGYVWSERGDLLAVVSQTSMQRSAV